MQIRSMNENSEKIRALKAISFAENKDLRETSTVEVHVETICHV